MTTLCWMANEFRCGLYFELLLFLLNLQVFVVDLFAALAGTISGMTNMHYQPNLTQSVLQAFKRKVSMYRLACFTRPFHGFFFVFWLGPASENLSTRLERTLKTSKLAKCESDLLITNEDSSRTQNGAWTAIVCSSIKNAHYNNSLRAPWKRCTKIEPKSKRGSKESWIKLNGHNCD